MPYPPSRPPSFRDRVEEADLELHGVRARAFRFRGCPDDRARALVCLAGMGADGRSFVRQRPLADDRLVLPLNLPWETPPGADPLLFAAEVVEEYLASERLERPVLLGSSFGGAVAAIVALRGRAPLGALVLVDAVLSRRQIPLATTLFVDVLEAPDPLARLVSPIAAQLMGGFGLDREGRDELVREARHFSGRELKRRLTALLGLDLYPDLPRLAALPVLFVHGRRDLLVPLRAARKAAALVPGARFEVVDRAGHVPYLSHPQAFNAIAADFLRGLAAAAPARRGEARAP
ncbi:MAG: alpha/beta fold hydrolase [Anaeromyxobacteraceae bacterium]